MSNKYVSPEAEIIVSQLDEFCDITTSSSPNGFLNGNISVDTDDLDENVLTDE